jgi:hypothetical protein
VLGSDLQKYSANFAVLEQIPLSGKRPSMKKIEVLAIDVFQVDIFDTWLFPDIW